MKLLLIKNFALGILLIASAIATTVARGDETDDVVPAALHEQHTPGAAVAVIHRGKVVKAQGYGLANVELDVPVTPETIFQSGSVGKQFTAAAVMLLVQEGKLRLDEPVRTYLPEAPKDWPATVRHLLTHTSGMGDITTSVNLRRDYTEDELLRLAFKLPREFQPGEKFQYSNTGYVVLGILVSKVSGKFYGDFLRRRIFEPFKMKTTRVISEADIVPHRAGGYRIVDQELKNQEWVSPTFNSTGDGSLYFSLNDLIQWDAALGGNDVLTANSLQQMWTPAKTSDGKSTGYGFGWFVKSAGGHPWIYHTGVWQGFTTYIGRYPDDQLTIIVLMNLAAPEKEGMLGGNPLQLGKRLAPIYEPAIVHTAHPRGE